jgi:restriction system protein
MRDVVAVVAREFGLTPEDLDQRLQSGQSLFGNRVGWAVTYLKKAGLLEAAGRAQFRITAEGLKVLAKPPSRIDRSFLLRYPTFVEFVQPRVDAAKPGEASRPRPLALPEADTPRERIDDAARELALELADELLAKVKTASPQFFELLVIRLLRAMGYGGTRADAAEHLGRSGDGGIDGVIRQDRLGLEAVYVQAKRWENTVGRPTVQAFAGSLDGARARKGVLLTTANVSPEARDYVGSIEKRIVLIDGKELVALMIEHGIGVLVESTVEIKRLNLAYFDDE